MKCLITGGAGFIGSNLAKALVQKGDLVVCADNFELGSRKNLKELEGKRNFVLEEGDVSERGFVERVLRAYDIEIVYHLAANSDIRKSARDPGIDLKNTFQTTYAVLEAMRRSGGKALFFASTSAVYGDKPGVLLKEQEGGLSPVSYYGAGKLASEAFISAYAHMNSLCAVIFRFPNVIGPGLTHGVIYDFMKKLNRDRKVLEILGDGTQRKPYIYISDLIRAIEGVGYSGRAGAELFNVGVEGSTSVREIADMVCESMGLGTVPYQFTGGKIGWKGDVPSFQYDLTKIHQCGWQAEFTSNEAVRETLKHVVRQEGEGCRL